MNRQSFITSIKESFKDNWITNEDVLNFTMILNGEDESNQLSKLYIASLFSDVTEEHSLKLIDINQLPCFDKEIDWEYCEEHPDDETYSFMVSVNLNQLYDDLIILNQLETPLTTVYRVAKPNGDGLYSSFFASLDVADNHPAPFIDDKLKTIFSSATSNSNYKNEWSFGFESLDAAYLWIGEEHIERLKHSDFGLVEMKIPSAFVIHGEKQSIYKKEHIIDKNFLDIDSIRPKIAQSYPKNKNMIP